ncbi:tyrosine-type recombinase/integrase [Paenibacillus sp. FSL L8-0506]|uniref:tyrosine-type recombinase/integrase n=1 Tax=Paenibacillus sp. FSL L8-0506 TaxID=2975335 RepID=UPI0030F82233
MKKKKCQDEELPQNIRERDGKYSYRYRVPSTVVQNGVEKKSSRQMESPRFDTLQEAVDFGILIKARKLQKNLVYEHNITISSWSITWLKEYILEREPGKNTIKSRKSSLGTLNKEIGGLSLRDLTPSMYQQLLFKFKEKGCSRSTITSHHTTASLMFKHAKRTGLISVDPTSDAVIPKEKKQARKPGEKKQILPKFLEKDQLKSFLQIARFMLTTNYWALFLVLSYTGLRISEAAALQWEDIDTTRRTIDINKQLHGTSVLQYEFLPPKNEQSERIISYGDTVSKALEVLYEKQNTERSSFVDFNPNDNFVFWNGEFPGYPIAITGIGKVMRKVLKKADLPESLTPHSFRHTHVSLLASNPKVSLPEIQARIGHKSNSKVTALIYLHVTKNRQMEIADDFEWAINN